MDHSAGVDESPLNGDDKFEILDYLQNLRAHCYKIGTAFRLSDDTLECIKKESSDEGEAMIKVVANWLNLNYNWNRFGKPSWKALVKAVANPIGGNNTALAMQIAEDHRDKEYQEASGSVPPSTVQTVRNGQEPSETPVCVQGSSTLSDSPKPIMPRELCADLKDVAAHWYKLGIQLNFDPAKLSKIQADFNEKTSKVDYCFLKVLQAWKEQTPELFTKQELVKALRSIDEKGLASRIERKADFKMELQPLTIALEECKSKYFKLGMQLGVEYTKLKEFESFSGDCGRCLDELLNEYMRNMNPSVEEVCQAVKSVGRTDLANELRDKRYKGRQFYCKQLEE